MSSQTVVFLMKIKLLIIFLILPWDIKLDTHNECRITKVYDNRFYHRKVYNMDCSGEKRILVTDSTYVLNQIINRRR